MQTAKLIAGRELDAEIQRKIMGYHLAYGITGAPLDRYSTDIAAAMSVVERMRTRGWLWEIEIGTENDPEFAGGSTTRANIFRRDVPGVVGHGGTLQRGQGESQREHSMDDVPLAICRAALAAVSR